MHRFLGSLVTTRGYRVAEIHVDHRPEAAATIGRDGWPSLRNLLAVLAQRWHAQAEQSHPPATIPVAMPRDHSGRKAA
jgi:hypothetical protein